jgi:hypothetical protein
VQEEREEVVMCYSAKALNEVGAEGDRSTLAAEKGRGGKSPWF